jgi:hypothetical protein
VETRESSGAISLRFLHYVIQNAMGWDDSHLHQYFVGQERIGIPDPEFGNDVADESKFTLASVAPKKGSKFRYEYDFGDGWLHEVKIEEIEQAVAEHIRPVCTDGERNCPPEDVGGIPGYEALVAAMANPRHRSHRRFIEWLDGPFDPEFFNLEDTNKSVSFLKY